MKTFRLMMAGLASVVLLAAALAAAEPPAPAFGVIADIQYGDKDTAMGRRYRESLEVLPQTVSNLNAQPLAFVIQLGDIIEGIGKNSDAGLPDWDKVLSVFNTLTAPKYHVIGNHDMYSLGIGRLKEKLQFPSRFYDFTVAACPGWRFLVMDTEQAGTGEVGNNQLDWLSETLARAAKSQERVIVFAHHPLLAEAANRGHQLKNAEPVLERLEKSGQVAAWFNGHFHQSGYCFRNGIHHVTFRGHVQNPAGGHAIIRLFPDRIEQIGFGTEQSRTMPLPAALKR